MKINRENAVRNAGKEGRFGLILGTLGRQGSTKVLSNLKVGVCVTSYKLININYCNNCSHYFNIMMFLR